MKRIIRESVMSTSALRVDRKAGIIHGVKVLGLVSENGRRYTPAAVKAAAKLYEGVRVNVDHPEKDASQPRSAYDRLGKLINIRYVEGEGLYGDLEILMTHPMAKRICEAAERMPDAFGMSHNAQGEGEENKDGTFVVSKIVEVRHVDLVADPATTKSLSESTSMKKMKESNEKAMQIAKEWERLQKIAADNAYKAKDNKIHQAWSLRATQLANIVRTAYMQAEHGTIPQGPDTLHGGRYATTKSTTTELPEGVSSMDELKEAIGCMREAMAKLEMCMKEAYNEEEGEEADEKDAMEAADEPPSEEIETDKEKTDAEEAEAADSETVSSLS